MIPEKQLKLPRYKTRKIRRRLTLFQEGGDTLSAVAFGFRASGHRFVKAGGVECMGQLPGGTAELIPVHGHGRGLFAIRGDSLYSLDGSECYVLPEPPNTLLRYLDASRESAYLYAVMEHGLSIMHGNGTVRIPGAAGGDCGCICYERIFTAKGCRVFYSTPLEPNNWEYGLRTAGHVDLPDEGGNILALVPYLERIYIFREQGITTLRVAGEALDFKATTLPFSCGRIQKQSIQFCAGRPVFFTENGFYAVYGTICTRLSGMGSSYVTMKSAAAEEYYYSTAVVKGEPCLYVADVEGKKGYFIPAEADCVCAYNGLYFTRDGMLYRLSEKKNGRAAVFTEKSLLGLSPSNKFMDGLCLEGEGLYTVKVQSERGVRTVSGRAGTFLRFPSPLPGTAFSFTAETHSEYATLKELLIVLREEDVLW